MVARGRRCSDEHFGDEKLDGRTADPVVRSKLSDQPSFPSSLNLGEEPRRERPDSLLTNLDPHLGVPSFIANRLQLEDARRQQEPRRREPVPEGS